MFWLISICKFSSQSDRYGKTRSKIFRENVDFLDLVFVMPGSLIYNTVATCIYLITLITDGIYIYLCPARDYCSFTSRKLKKRDILCCKGYALCINLSSILSL